MEKLKSGHYYGAKVKHTELHGLVLNESNYAGFSHLPVHDHENIFFCLVLRGGYSETKGSETSDCKPGTLIFHPRYEKHENIFGETDTGCFNIEMKDSWLKDLIGQKTELNRPYHFENNLFSQNFYRIYRNFVEFDSASELSIQGNMLALVAELIRYNSTHNRFIPVWLKRVHDKLNDSFSENLNLIELSELADVHPVHLTRTFKHYYKNTPGDYLRKLRVEKSISLLREGKLSLSQIGFKCGFFDQSHFSKNFKKHTGFTPKKYRDLIKHC